MAAAASPVFSVPAHPWLFSDHDRMLEHHRRYRPAQLGRSVARHLHVVRTGSLFTTLVPPAGADRRARTARSAPRPDRRRGLVGWTGRDQGDDGGARRRRCRWGCGSAASVAVPGLSTWAVAVRRRRGPGMSGDRPTDRRAVLRRGRAARCCRTGRARAASPMPGCARRRRVDRRHAGRWPDRRRRSEPLRARTSPTNVGKGEAVRRGPAGRPTPRRRLLGYFDADLATPPDEMARLVSMLPTEPTWRRARLAGGAARPPRRRSMRPALPRPGVRHRQQPRAPPEGLRHAVRRQGASGTARRCGRRIARPFTSRWAFDVELLGRLRAARGRAGRGGSWRCRFDVVRPSGSKLRPAPRGRRWSTSSGWPGAAGLAR